MKRKEGTKMEMLEAVPIVLATHVIEVGTAQMRESAESSEKLPSGFSLRLCLFAPLRLKTALGTIH